jgi:hypothetical protein
MVCKSFRFCTHSLCTWPLAWCLFYFSPEQGGSFFLQNSGKRMPNHIIEGSKLHILYGYSFSAYCFNITVFTKALQWLLFWAWTTRIICPSPSSFVAPCPTAKLEDHYLVSFHDWSFIICACLEGISICDLRMCFAMVVWSWSLTSI